MRRTSGTVKLGGKIGYCPQTAWIQNASVRENVTFGRPFNEERYWKAIRDSCLDPDLKLLPYGDMTEVGERVSPVQLASNTQNTDQSQGISLSGGQKQRLNLCRALYSESPILIFDDPLSALDAHVGKAVFQNILQKTLSNGKPPTRILVTHALHFLPQVEYIYAMVDGRIAEMGTYKELMSRNGAFARYVSEFGGEEEEQEEEGESSEKTKKDADLVSKAPDKPRAGPSMMQAEERGCNWRRWAIWQTLA
jgi:ABC-type multidrug transport system fused ATPase/permease subunit